MEDILGYLWMLSAGYNAVALGASKAANLCLNPQMGAFTRAASTLDPKPCKPCNALLMMRLFGSISQRQREAP
jgi:hypothetical protein